MSRFGWIALSLLLCTMLYVSHLSVQAAPTESELSLDRVTIEADPATGKKYLLVKVKELLSLISGERNPSSGTNSYLVTRQESNGANLSDGTTAKTISASPAHLVGVFINAALAGTLTITCLTDETGTAKDLVLPIGMPAGFHSLSYARCETSLTVTKSSASDNGKIVIHWRPI